MELNILAEFCGDNKTDYRSGEPMSTHTSFKIGGPADIFITPDSEDKLSEVIKKCSELKTPYFILGKGSNVLVSDRGIEGAVISMSRMNEITVNGDKITCLAGAALSEVCRTALNSSLSGLEFAYGIPGSVGGALYMNAGAYGGEMSDIAESACYVTENGEQGCISACDMALGYRTSVFKNGGMIITSVTLCLHKGEKSEIEEKMNDYISRRREKQPLEYPSAGSIFKRPKGYFAGALIEKNGLKGYKSGGAMVSEKHAGFVINCGNASAMDVKNVIDKVKKTVLEADGVALEPEVILVGKF